MKKRPEVFDYYDYRKFLKDIFEHLKKTKNTSMRSIALKSSLTAAYLSMIVSGKRKLDLDKGSDLISVLNLTETEGRFFKYLVRFNDSDNASEQSDVFEKLKRYKKFKGNYLGSFNTHQYLSKWYYVAIRELSFSRDFKADAEWIQKKFFPQLLNSEINEALSFLEENNLLGNNDYSYLEDIECVGDIYKMSLKKFHYQMLDVTKDSIESVDSKKREIQGYTKALSAEGFEKARKILDNALSEVRSICDETEAPRELYHFYFLGFPLTQSEEDKC